MTADPALALPKRVLLWSLPILAAVALCLSGYLLWLGKDAAAGCGDAALLDCEGVLSSRWAKWLYMPVSLPAALLYGGVLAASLVLLFDSRERSQRMAANTLLLLSTLAGGAALWFVGLQLFSLDGFCPYCMAVHACGLTLAGLSVLLVVWEGTLPLAKPLLLSSLGLAVLVGGQLAVRPNSIEVADVADIIDVPETDSPPDIFDDPTDTDEKKVSLGESFDEPDLDFLKVPAEEKPLASEPNPMPDNSSASTQPESTKKTPASGLNIAFLDDLADTADEILNLPASSESSEDPTDSVPNTGEVKTEPKAVIAKRMNSQLVNAPAAVDGKLELFGGQMKLSLDDVIVLGSPKASHIVVELFDYSCQHCRALHWRMEEVRRRYGDQLAVVMLPVPLNAGCNPAIKETAEIHANACLYSRLAIAIWQKRRSQFPAFHARLMEGTDLPEPGQMRYEAGRILGAKELDEALLSDSIDKQLNIGILLYKVSRMGTIPKLILGQAIATGKFDNTDELNGLFESKLGLKPLDTQ